MTTSQSVLLSLIKQSQFGKSEPVDLSGVDLDALLEEADKNAVIGLIAPEVPESLKDDNWEVVEMRPMVFYVRYCKHQNEVKRVLEEASIPFVILKGNASAVYYAVPSRRTMGDIDIYVPKKYFSAAKKVLTEAGLVEGRDNGRHADFTKEKLSVEIHHRFSHDVDIESYLVSGLETREVVTVEGYSFPMLPKLANGLVLLDHMRSHLKTTLGIRQIIDWMMYVYRNLDDSYWHEEFQAVAREKGMETLAIVATRMCQIYLGLPESITWCKEADESVCSRLMELTLKSGNFSHPHGDGRSVEKVGVKMKQEGTFSYLQRAGENNWKAYQKHHWLKPFCWFYQICRYIKKGYRSDRNTGEFIGDIDRGNERYSLLKSLNIK